MRTFLVTFHQLVCDDAGRERRVLRRQAVVRAVCDVSALWQAKAMLCAETGVADWRMRADSCELAPLAELAA